MALSSSGILHVLVRHDESKKLQVYQLDPENRYRYMQHIVLDCKDWKGVIGYKLHAFKHGYAIYTQDILTQEYLNKKLFIFTPEGKAAHSYDLNTTTCWDLHNLYFISGGCLWKWNNDLEAPKKIKPLEAVCKEMHHLKKEEWEPLQESLFVLDGTIGVLQSWKDDAGGHLSIILENEGSVDVQAMDLLMMVPRVVYYSKGEILNLFAQEYTEEDGTRTYEKVYLEYDIAAKSLKKLDPEKGLHPSFGYGGSLPVYFKPVGEPKSP
jgi:hypothetical protein